MNDEVITIALENVDERFTVSKALLCDASDYFKKALDGGFREASDKVLRLPDCDADTLRLFTGYLTRRTLPSFNEIYAGKGSHEEKTEEVVARQCMLVRLWAFGGKYFLPRMQNAAMVSLANSLCESYNVMKAIALEPVQLAFEITGRDSALCKMLAMEFLEDWECGSLEPDTIDHFEVISGFFAVFLSAMAKKSQAESGGFTKDDDHDWRPSTQDPLDKEYFLTED